MIRPLLVGLAIGMLLLGPLWSEAQQRIRFAQLELLTAGSIPFVSSAGVLTQDNTGLFWLASTDRLGINDTTPDAKLDIVSTAAATSVLRLEHVAVPTAPYLQIGTSGSTIGDILTVAANGMVGLGGETAPTALLHLQAVGPSDLLRLKRTDNGQTWSVSLDQNDFAIEDISADTAPFFRVNNGTGGFSSYARVIGTWLFGRQDTGQEYGFTFAGNDWTFTDVTADRHFLTVHDPTGRIGVGWQATGQIGRPDLVSAPFAKFLIKQDTPAVDILHLVHAPAGTADYLQLTTHEAWLADAPNEMGNILKVTATGLLGLKVFTPTEEIHLNGVSGFGGIKMVGDLGACFMLRDSDNAGFTKCTALNGAFVCSIDSDGLC